MNKINSAHSLLDSIGGQSLMLMTMGFFVDNTTMPKQKSKPNYYGESLMSHFDRKRKETQRSERCCVQ